MQLLSLSDLPSDLQQQVIHQRLSTGQILVQQGETAHHLYWVMSGQIRLVSFVNQQMITHYFVRLAIASCSICFSAYPPKKPR